MPASLGEPDQVPRAGRIELDVLAVLAAEGAGAAAVDTAPAGAGRASSGTRRQWPISVNMASNIGTSTRWPLPVRWRAISAMTMLGGAKNAPKLDASGRAE